MALARKIILCDAGPNADFPNNFKKLEIQDPISLINGSNFFVFDVDISGFELAYLYMNSFSNVDLDMTIYRSACYEGFDTEFAVPIPGGILKMVTALPLITSADFNISVYGADKLWLEIVPAGALAAPTNVIKDLCIMIKR